MDQKQKGLEFFFTFSTFFIATLLLSFASQAYSNTAAHEVDDEKEFTYDSKSPKGPEHWGEIHEDWSLCNKGKMQSPIDLKNKRVQLTTTLGKLQKYYKPTNATLVNRGHDMMLRWIGGAGRLVIDKKEYQLKQCHWHTPSEHTINGKRYDLEVHMVHESADGKVAVVGILYEIGPRDHFLIELEEHFRILGKTKGREESMGVIDPEHLGLDSATKYYRYIGSLTVPPCTQDVIWTILRNVKTVGYDQVRLIREAVHDDSKSNSRPTQRYNERDVDVNRPDHPST